MMSNESALSNLESAPIAASTARPLRSGRKLSMSQPIRLTQYETAGETSPRQAEQFYLQKQIQSQTPMVIVLEDGQQVEGVIEWYDRGCLKVRGREKTLVYKSAIKYMHKLGETGV